MYVRTFVTVNGNCRIVALLWFVLICFDLICFALLCFTLFCFPLLTYFHLLYLSLIPLNLSFFPSPLCIFLSASFYLSLHLFFPSLSVSLSHSFCISPSPSLRGSRRLWWRRFLRAGPLPPHTSPLTNTRTLSRSSWTRTGSPDIEKQILLSSPLLLSLSFSAVSYCHSLILISASHVLFSRELVMLTLYYYPPYALSLSFSLSWFLRVRLVFLIPYFHLSYSISSELSLHRGRSHTRTQ